MAEKSLPDLIDRLEEQGRAPGQHEQDRATWRQAARLLRFPPYTVTLEHVLAVLNEAARLDPAALGALINYRVPCAEGFADHPTIQVGPEAEGDGYELGMLGLLNGLFGADADGWGYLAAELDADGGCSGFAFTPARELEPDEG